MTMYDRYTGYLQGREPLTSMAYFCLTMLTKHLNKGRKKAATKYRIGDSILKDIERLSSIKVGLRGHGRRLVLAKT